jgi:sec-independent protein translocase protein TatA
MFDDLFDSPWKILIVAVVIIVLFGSRKLPDAARSLGKSMRILKTEMQGVDDEEPGTGKVQAAPDTPAAPAQLQAAGPAPDVQAQITALQEQLRNLERQAAGAGGVTPADADTQTDVQQAR